MAIAISNVGQWRLLPNAPRSPGDAGYRESERSHLLRSGARLGMRIAATLSPLRFRRFIMLVLRKFTTLTVPLSAPTVRRFSFRAARATR